MKAKRITIRIIIFLALCAAGYFVGAWLAVLLTAGLVVWCLWTELWNQIKPNR